MKDYDDSLRWEQSVYLQLKLASSDVGFKTVSVVTVHFPSGGYSKAGHRHIKYLIGVHTTTPLTRLQGQQAGDLKGLESCNILFLFVKLSSASNTQTALEICLSFLYLTFITKPYWKSFWNQVQFDFHQPLFSSTRVFKFSQSVALLCFSILFVLSLSRIWFGQTHIHVFYVFIECFF